jgi:DNA-binding SARP family transcriptional activator/Tfp pilus assembly protein PilF
MNSKVTYRQQYTRCGKERCRKCREGNGHGPYWYAYWSEHGRTVSKYIGIHLPDQIDVEQQTRRNRQHTASITAATPALEAIAASPHLAQSQHATDVHIVPLQRDSQVMRIHVLGQFRIERLQQGRWSEAVHHIWKRRRARALLGCLLSSPGRRLGREQIMESIWPDLDTQTAANRLNGAVHELRQILEPENSRPASSYMLRLERDLLSLADRTILWVDADAFESLVNEANSYDTRELTATSAEHVKRLLERADSLYGGDYLLEELYSEWAAPRRDALKRSWTGLQLKLSALYEAQGALTGAMDPLNRLLALDATNETAVQRLMVLLTQLDRRGEALTAYRRLAARLQQNYEGEPLPETHKLYEELRQGLPASALPHPITLAHDHRARPAKEEHDHIALPDHAETSKASPQIRKQGQSSTSIASEVSRIQLPRTNSQPLQLSGNGNAQFGRSNQSPLVGREQELQTMRQLLFAVENRPESPNVSFGAADNNGVGRQKRDKNPLHIALLTGEAGIGKTRLAEELSHEASSRGWRVAWSRAYEQEGTVPYRPWIELLRSLLQQFPIASLTVNAGAQQNSDATMLQSPVTMLERLSALLPELRDILPQNTRSYPPLPPEQERLHLWEATLELVTTLSKRSPLLLVMDDLHWADGSSRELLAYIMHHIRDQRILLIGTCRDVELAPQDNLRTLITDLRREQAILTLAIQPLSLAQIGSLVSYLPHNIVQSIQAQAGGNPFFAEELARVSDTPLPESTSNELGFVSSILNPLAVTRQQAQEATSFVKSSSIPEGIAAVLDRRLDKLSRECQLLLGKVAVLGGAFELQHLLSMANEDHEDTMLDLLDEALHAGLLTEEGNGTRIIYHFWHPLIVSHLYDRLSSARRAQLHRRAASTLIHAYAGHEHEVAAAITNHLLKGGGEASQIAYYAELAGNQAFSLAAFAEAQQYYMQAVQTITNADHCFTLTASGAQFIAPLPWQGLRSPIHVARVLERICECAIVQGNYEEARNFYECILTLRNLYARETPIDARYEAQIQALIWREIGRTWLWNGDFVQARASHEQGKQLLLDAGITSGAAWACVHLELGRICWLQGNYVQASRIAVEALALLQEALQQQTECSQPAQPSTPNRGEQEQGKGTPPRETFQTQIERTMTGNPLEIGRARELLGLIAANTGQYAEALEHLHRALSIFEKHDLVIAMVKVCGNLGAVYLTRTENALAQPYMQRALELAERMGNLPTIAQVTGNLGEMSTRAGKLIQAEEWFRRSLAVGERINDPDHISWCSVALAGTLQDLGKLQEAAESLQRSLALARSMKSTRAIGSALIALGDLRIAQAVIACNLMGNDIDRSIAQVPQCRRLLLRARATLKRAASMEELEVEAAVEARLNLASAYFCLGDIQLAEQEAQRSMRDAERFKLSRLHGRSLRLLGRILATQDHHEQSDRYFEEALSIFRTYDMRLDYARALHGYGVVLRHRNIPGSAAYRKGAALLYEARGIFADCHAVVDLEWVNRLLQSKESQPVP